VHLGCQVAVRRMYRERCRLVKRAAIAAMSAQRTKCIIIPIQKLNRTMKILSEHKFTPCCPYGLKFVIVV
jgi:hypothetical protein